MGCSICCTHSNEKEHELNTEEIELAKGSLPTQPVTSTVALSADKAINEKGACRRVADCPSYQDAKKLLSRTKSFTSIHTKSLLDRKEIVRNGIKRANTMIPKIPSTSSTRTQFTGIRRESMPIDRAQFCLERRNAIISRYEEVAIIGRGTYGVVKRVRDKATGTFRAMKVLSRAGFRPNIDYKEEVEIMKSLVRFGHRLYLSRTTRMC